MCLLARSPFSWRDVIPHFANLFLPTSSNAVALASSTIRSVSECAAGLASAAAVPSGGGGSPGVVPPFEGGLGIDSTQISPVAGGEPGFDLYGPVGPLRTYLATMTGSPACGGISLKDC